jgi:hypothetical protein
VSSRIESELRHALEQASESVMPRADLADRVRRASRASRRRHALTGAIAAGLAVVVAGSLIAAYGTGHNKQPAAHHHVKRHHGLHIRQPFATPADSPVAVAASGRWLYATFGDYPIATLAVYDRGTGRLVRSIGIPAMASVLRVGPGGLVWLAFYAGSNGGGTGVWLLSPDLRLRSKVNLDMRRYQGVAPFDALPTGVDTAMLATSGGLARLTLPPPGQPGTPAMHWGPGVPGSASILSGVAEQLAAFAGRIAVRVGSDTGLGLISFAGAPRAGEFIPRSADAVSSVAATADGLWTVLVSRLGHASLGLLRLDRRLSPDTPRPIRGNPAFKSAQQVVTLGSTVWVVVVPPSAQPSLACFTDRRGRLGPIVTGIARSAQPGADYGFATAGDTLYVAAPTAIVSFPIPPPCR